MILGWNMDGKYLVFQLHCIFRIILFSEDPCMNRFTHLFILKLFEKGNKNFILFIHIDNFNLKNGLEVLYFLNM